MILRVDHSMSLLREINMLAKSEDHMAVCH